MCLLFVMTIFFPIGTILSACFGYTFELINISGFAVIIAVLSVCTVILDFIFKNLIESKVIQILLAVIPPLSLFNAVFYMFVCSRICVIASVFISAVCCCFLAVRQGKPLALKNAALVLFAIMILPTGFFGGIVLLFGNIGQNTVVQTVESPNGKKYAQVVDSDQGALGGDTLVDVYEKSRINALLFKMEKQPQRVYSGDWGEFKNMQIHWEDDNCLVINSVAYEIE